jgi:hypothetical protein
LYKLKSFERSGVFGRLASQVIGYAGKQVRVIEAYGVSLKFDVHTTFIPQTNYKVSPIISRRYIL